MLADIPGIVGIVVTEQPRVTLWKRIRRAIRRFGFGGMISRVLLKLVLNMTGETSRRRADLARVVSDSDFPTGIPTYKTIGVNSAQTQAQLRELAPDILCVYGTYIVSNATLSIAKQHALNLHTGLSPRYRGADCDFWPLYNKELNFIGATVHECTPDLDGGAIFGTTAARLEANDGLGAVFGRCVAAGSVLYKRVVEDLISGREVKTIRQDLGSGKEYKVAMRNLQAELYVDFLIRRGLIRNFVGQTP